MPDVETIALGFSSFGTVLAIILFASQIPMFRQLIRAGSSEGFTVPPTFFLFGNCLLWSGCAIFVQHRIDLLAVNGIGVAFTIVYLAIFIRYTHDPVKKRKLFTISMSIFAFSVGVFVVLFLLPLGVPAEPAGVIAKSCAVAFNICLFGGAINAVRDAVRTLDASKVPTLLTVVSLLCAMNWGLFGLVIDDAFVAAPNGIGVLLSGGQLAALVYIRVQQKKSGGRGVGAKRLEEADADAESQSQSRAAGTPAAAVEVQGWTANTSGAAAAPLPIAAISSVRQPSTSASTAASSAAQERQLAAHIEETLRTRLQAEAAAKQAQMVAPVSVDAAPAARRRTRSTATAPGTPAASYVASASFDIDGVPEEADHHDAVVRAISLKGAAPGGTNSHGSLPDNEAHGLLAAHEAALASHHEDQFAIGLPLGGDASAASQTHAGAGSASSALGASSSGIGSGSGAGVSFTVTMRAYDPSPRSAAAAAAGPMDFASRAAVSRRAPSGVPVAYPPLHPAHASPGSPEPTVTAGLGGSLVSHTGAAASTRPGP